MRKRILFVLSLVFISANVAAAQNRTVTNADLNKHRQKRLAAQREYRENYERLGFPSPEELERQIEQSRVERTELAARLRAENLERERLSLERQRAENEARSRNYQVQTQNYSSPSDDYFYNYQRGGFYGFSNFGYQNNRFNRFNRTGFGNRRGFGYQPRIEYRNNLPVLVQPPPQIIFAPRRTNGGRRN